MKDPLVVIPYHNGAEWIGRLLRTLPARLDVLIVNDQSDERMPRVERPNVELVHTPVRSYWAGACNYGASLRPGRDLLFLNQDIHFQGEGWLGELGKIVDSGISITGNWVKGHPCWPHGYVDGVFMYVKRDLWDAVGGMDAVHYPMWGSSCLLQVQGCRKGYRAAPFKALRTWLVHHRSGNLGDSFRELLTEEVGHTKNDGNVYRRVPPYVSVVISAHGDYDKYLPDAVGSILAQTRQDFQIIITLDGTARPELREMAKGYADPWKGIFYVQQPEERRYGPCVVRNAGVAAVKSRFYVLVLDGDDYAEPNALDVMVNTAEAHPHSFVYGDLRWVGDREGVRQFQEFDFERLLQSNFIPSFILYPKQMWQDVGGYPLEHERGWDDYSFAIGAALKEYCGVHVPQVVFNYRRHGRSRNHDSQERRDELRGLLRKRYPDAFERRVRPMCCGGKRASAVKPAKGRISARNVQPPKGVGGAGMIEVHYLGSLGASFSARGPVTGTRYRIRKGWVGWMDARDALRLIGDSKVAGISREYEYTGRTSGGVVAPVKAKPVIAAAPAAVPAKAAGPAVAEAAVEKDPPIEEAPADEARPFLCVLCPQTFKKQAGLDTHTRLKHPEEYARWKQSHS